MLKSFFGDSELFYMRWSFRNIIKMLWFFFVFLFTDLGEFWTWGVMNVLDRTGRNILTGLIVISFLLMVCMVHNVFIISSWMSINGNGRYWLGVFYIFNRISSTSS